QVGTEDNSLVWGSTTATASDGTTLSYENNGTSYVICGRNSGGNKTYFYNSSDGGSVDDGAYATVAACIAGES
ncbi:MAG TPA: pilus assembly protein PilA, partial [Actinoplanes sp.]|nr:pilus assembly protein PilA [Actinoplanes sp.]